MYHTCWNGLSSPSTCHLPPCTLPYLPPLSLLPSILTSLSSLSSLPSLPPSPLSPPFPPYLPLLSLLPSLPTSLPSISFLPSLPPSPLSPSFPPCLPPSSLPFLPPHFLLSPPSIIYYAHFHRPYTTNTTQENFVDVSLVTYHDCDDNCLHVTVTCFANVFTPYTHTCPNSTPSNQHTPY